MKRVHEARMENHGHYVIPQLIPLMLVVMMPLMGMALTEMVDGIKWEYEVRDGKAEIGDDSELVSGPAISPSTTGAITIPSLLGGYVVSSIGDRAFDQCSGLTEVSIPDSVTSIGDYAFYYCTGLTEISIPDSVTSIGHHAFYHCTGLIEMSIPDSVTSIGNFTFSHCTGLTLVEIPMNVTSIGPAAFTGCSSLTSVIIPASVTNISYNAFEHCSSLKSVTIPDCFSMSKVFPDSYETLEAVEILSKNGKVADNAFEDCRLLTSVTIDDGIVEIGESAFENCRHLEEITIPASVKKIDEYAFYGCGRLKTVQYLGETPEIGASAFGGTAASVSHANATTVSVTVTNVVVQYVLNSVRPDFAVPQSSDTGFVNIIAEVKGGCVAVPESWADNYDSFVPKFGTDFVKALAMKTGKKDGAGNEMFVWQDYVAGTDPTDEKDVFTASISIVDGKVTISYTPELDAERKSLRKYTTWGKKSLTDAVWTEVKDGDESGYNFFKVSVEMR